MLEGTYRADRHGPKPDMRTETTHNSRHSDRDMKYLYPYLDVQYLPKMLVEAHALALLFDVGVVTIRRWARNRDMPAPLKIGGSARWDVEQIRDWIRRGCPDRDGETNGEEQ